MQFPGNPWLLAILVVVGLPACGDVGAVSSAAPEPPGAAVSIEVVTPTSRAPQVTVPGLVEAKARIELPFRVSGYVARFHVEEGDTVEAGQLLAELDTADLERETRVAQAELQRASARAVEAESTFERQSRLRESEASSEHRFDEARSLRDVARAEHSLARVRLEDAEDRLAKARLVAPVAGRVERRLLDPHEVAREHVPVLVLAAVETVVIRAAVADSLAPGLQVGNEVVVRSALWPDRTFSAYAVPSATSRR